MSKQSKYVIIWYAPCEKKSVFASTSEVVSFLTKDYGIDARKSETSELVGHNGIEVPIGHSIRASAACADFFGRSRYS